MAKEKKKITPMVQHYIETKEKYPDHILFYRMGDFYEMFFEDATIVSNELNITLTSRAGIPMAGVPHHAKKPYLKKMIDKGYSVAICEQVEDPKKVKGRIVKREVVEIITPGVQSDYESLDPNSNNYLLAISYNKKTYYLAYFDISTSDFFLTNTKNEVELISEISKISPSEIILDKKNSPPLPILDILKKRYFTRDINFEKSIISFYDIKYSKNEKDILNISFSYIESLKKLNEFAIPKIKRYSIGTFMTLPITTINNLEIFKTSIEKKEKGSLFREMNKTITSMGARKLKNLLIHPLKDIDEIEKRVEGVEFFIESFDLREEIKKVLKEIQDIERLLGRVLTKSLQPKDMLALSNSMKKLKFIITLLKNRDDLPKIITDLILNYKNVEELINRIDITIVEEPPATMKDGYFIKKGVSKTLDKVIDIAENGQQILSDLEVREKLETSIPTIKVRYNKVFGYFIEVSKSYVKSVPKHYQAKQTLANATRYITQELKELEVKLLEAKEKRLKLENKIYEDILNYIMRTYLEIKENSEVIAFLDLLLGLSLLAIENEYTKPEFIDGSQYIEIENGRHPVIEKNLDLETFIPNSLQFDDEKRLIILTGPNMAGKSTVMRQTALIVLMAQIGSYVPADLYRGTIFDAIFTRVGAGDNLTRGESTFMVEMKEISDILKTATKNSLIIVDELGRGTSTFDGLSLAWSIAEYIHDKLQALTMFATHYHELTKLKDTKKYVVNYSIQIKEIDGKLYFLRKLVEGTTSKSYGINVASLAGVPKQIITKAEKILNKLEKKEININHIKKTGTQRALPIFDVDEKDLLREKLKTIDPYNTTPFEALSILNELKKLE